MIRKKKCSCCETIVLAVNKDGFCEECQEKVENGEFIICENEGCTKKVGISAKNKMCTNCNLEQNVCLECGRVSDDGLDSEGSCPKCNGTALYECEKCHEKVEYELDENNRCKECKNVVGTGEEPPKKSLLPIIAASALLLVGVAFFFMSSSEEPAPETKVAKKKPVEPAKDSTPNSFSFANVNNANLNTEVKSNEVSINGINTQVPIKVTNGKYSINGNTWSNRNGVVSNGSKIKVKHLSNNSYSAVNATVLTVENVSATFESRTKNRPVVSAPIEQIEPRESGCTSLDIARGKEGC